MSRKRHLAPIASIKYVTLDAGRRLIRLGNPVGGMFHEFREVVHVHALSRRPRQSATRNLAPHFFGTSFIALRQRHGDSEEYEDHNHLTILYLFSLGTHRADWL